MVLGTKDMTTIYANALHIRELVDSGMLEVLNTSVSKQLEVWLEQYYPLRNWSTIIDWERLNSTVLQWNNASDDETVEWAMGTAIGKFSYGVLMYEAEQPCLLGSLDFMILNLDSLVWKAPGCRILFGALRNESGNIVFGNGAIEFNGNGTLFATTDA